jgi:23S rRNA pseudouridine2605 synthase
VRIRLQKLLAEGGVASRRQAEILITGGHVSVNGQLVRQLGSKADPEVDSVTVDGRPVKTRRRLYVALHKPRDIVCSRRDENQRRTALDLLPREWSSLYPVGRLDRDSEGLLLLTNDGDFCLRMTHPRFGVTKRYQATVDGRVEPAHLSKMTAGLEHDGETLRAQRVWLLRANNSHSLVELELTEGKNREVRRLFQTLSLNVSRLVRIQFGPIRLGELPAGKWRTLNPSEVASLLASAGNTQAESRNVDRKIGRKERKETKGE